ncbi:MAG: radical SAM protein, partial [Deltaproteobacteria bacterium]|nr:radical SAM protein [Deltaproteobacteria bacterium]
MEDDRAPIHSDSLKVSRLYKGKLSPEEALTAIMGPRFESYRARWNRARSFKELPSFPIHVDYEVMSKCNYSCPMCPMSVRDLTYSGDEKLEENRGKGEKRLSSSKIKELLEEGAAKGQAALGFGGLWEPLLYKDLPEIVSYGRDLGLVDMMVNTNGSLLTQNLAQDLIESGLTRLMVSLDALSPETYKQIRRGGNLEQVEENIRIFLEERKKRKSPLPLLRVSFLVTSINESELQGFMHHWEDRADFLSV